MNSIEYYQLEDAINKIEGLTTQVKEALNKMNNLIDDNIDNPEVWQGERSSKEFLKDWESFSMDFPSFISTFEKQSANIKTTLQNLRAQDV